MQTVNKILIVEDNPADVILLQESLGQFSYSQLVNITRVSDLDRLSGTAPELVFLDLNLPDGRGIESFLSVNRKFPDAAIIVVSGLEDEKMALQALQAGAQDYIVKGQFDDKSFAKSVTYSLERKRSQLNLRESKEQYRVLVDNAPEALVVLDMNTGKFINVSQSALELFKMTMEELSQKSVLDISAEIQADGRHSSEAAMEKLQEAIGGGKPHFEWLHIDSTGKTIPCEVWLVRIPSENRVLIRGSIIDITERKKAEEEIRTLEETRRLIMDSALDAIVGMDTEGKIIIWTPRAEQLFGWREEQVMGKLVADIIVPEELRAAHLQGLKRYLQTNTPVILNKLIEVTAIDRTGRRFPIELTVVPIRAEDSVFFCSFIRDITERHEARIQIEKSRKLSDDIIQTLPGLFYLFNRQGKYIRWNKRKETITGYSHDEIAAMHPLEFFSEDKEKVKQHIADCFEHGETVVEAELVTKEGIHIPFYFTGLLVEYEGQECLLCTGIDISDRKQAEVLLRESSERLRELSAHLQTVREEERIRISREIHDELGQQLTVLKMDISWLKRKIPADDPKVEQKMNDLMKVIDHTVKTVRKISSDLRPSLLDDLGLAAALEWHSQEFEKRSGIQTTFVAAIPEMEIEPATATAMFRIFQETLTNVARHADASVIEATLVQEDEKLVMRIRDNGKGFSKNDINNKRTLGILGMQERAAIIEGEYRIESSPGEGTVVEVKVPIGNHEQEKSLL